MSEAREHQLPAAGLLVNIDVDDLERGVRFYTEGLGLSVGRRFRERWIELVGASSNLYLLEKKPGTRATPTPGATRNYERHWTPVHLDFVVESIERARERVLAAGALLESDISEHPYGRLAIFSDPFGHGLCLIEFNSQGYDAPGS
jgi:predicted enzyme related to lactoylglutathione lyase